MLDNQETWNYRVPQESVLASLRRQLSHAPGRVALNCVRPVRSGLEIRPLTVFGMALSVQRARAVLAAAGVEPGDRVVISLSSPREFLCWIVACFSSGLTAVPIPAAGEMTMPAAFLDRVTGVLEDCAPRIVVVENRGRWERAVEAQSFAVTVLEAGLIDAPLADAAAFEPFVDQPHAVTAFLQYTSGSTGKPKGVVVTHGNLCANCEANRVASRWTPEDHMVSWLPLHHDMGLVGTLISCVYSGITTSIMTPVSFLGRPVTWLRAIHELRATLTAGPTFGYSLCVQKITDDQIKGLDLSCWRLAYVGAEPVTRAVLAEFGARFARCGFSPLSLFPVYGLAEATLSATFPEPGLGPTFDSIDRRRLAADRRAVPIADSEPSAMCITCLGPAIPGHAVRIVSPETGAECAEREVGEVVISGPSISTHYFGEPDERRRTRVHTGDLGYLVAGRLYMVDRLKDMVIVAGQNYSCSDLESAIRDIAGIRRGMAIAFSTAGRHGTEGLVVVAEVDPRANRCLLDLENDIRDRIRRRVGLNAETVHLAPKGTIEKTTSGKLRRRDCKAKFEAGLLPAWVRDREREPAPELA